MRPFPTACRPAMRQRTCEELAVVARTMNHAAEVLLLGQPDRIRARRCYRYANLDYTSTHTSAHGWFA